MVASISKSLDPSTKQFVNDFKSESTYDARGNMIMGRNIFTAGINTKIVFPNNIAGS